MAQDQQSQYNEIYTLGLEAGIKRDGTAFESRECSDGVWCRFQRGVPKKIGGYQQIFSTFNGLVRGMIMNSYNGVNYVFAGNNKNLDIFVTGQTLGVGSGPYQGIMLPGYSKFAVASVSLPHVFTITSATDISSAFPATTKIIFNQTTPVIYTVSTAVYATGTLTVTVLETIVGTPTNVWIADTYFQPNPNLLWQFNFQYSAVGSTLNLLIHPGLNLSNIDNGLKSQVYIGSTAPSSNETWTFTGLADTGGSHPTYRPITVDGGVCVLHPFIFVYGSNGFIANNNVSSIYADQQLTDWNGPLANQVNVASGKIVKGMPVRGGTASPSGLFWATDSLIRVSFINNGTTYWQYDIVSSEISIMSSSAVVEMDGVYYWMGVDRFYVYNGYVTVLPNDKNVNWLFDNLNYQQRQKVWATKVPRYNEVWFFYPRGGSTECTDAIIYNVKDKIWYDAGQADGARRSSGFTTEVFPTPIWAGWDYDVLFTEGYNTVAAPSGEPATTSSTFYLPGDVSTAIIPGSYITLSTIPTSTKYQINSVSYIFNLVENVSISVASPAVITYSSGVAPTNGTPVIFSTQSVSITVISGNPAVINYAFGTNPANGTAIKFSTNGALPTGITAGTTYYIINTTSTSSNISATLSGSAIIASGTQSGNHFITPAGVLPTGINPATTYYVINSSGSTSNISATVGGSAINTSGSTTGAPTVSIIPSGAGTSQITLVTPFPGPPADGTPIFGVTGGYGIWQHETGLNKITTKTEEAIYSSFTTCDISWVGGTPSNDSSPAVNRRMHLRRLEPDFVISGDMSLTIQGRKFAQSTSEISGPFTFNSNTEKIDLRVEYREMDLTFISNEVNGNYEMGRILITVELGDERP